jgi:hypothetical protein
MKSFVSASLLTLAMNVAAADSELTIYSGNFDAVASSLPGQGMDGYALVRETREFALERGTNTLTLSGLPAAIDAGGVRFIPQGDGVRIHGQRFNFALADQAELLRRSLGERVVVTQTQGQQRQTFNGRLLAAGDGLTLALENGAVLALSNYDSFQLEALPGGLFARPTLVWEVESARAGSIGFALDYPTGGLSWRAEYLAFLTGQGDDCRMDFSGAAQVLNRSGAGFEAARVTLVAGEPNRQRAPQPQMMMAKSMRADAYASPAPEPVASGEYHAYVLPQRIDLPDGSVQRAALLNDADGVRCTRRYESGSSQGRYRSPTPIVHPEFGPEGRQPVAALLEFVNAKQSGLGIALPAGRLRAFERGREGSEDFLGEATIKSTAIRAKSARIAPITMRTSFIPL